MASPVLSHVLTGLLNCHRITCGRRENEEYEECDCSAGQCGRAGRGRPAANAAFVMTLSDGVNTATVTDGVLNPLDGVVTFNGVLGAGAWIVNVTTGISKPVFPNNDGFAKMDLNSVNVTSAAGGTCRFG